MVSSKSKKNRLTFRQQNKISILFYKNKNDIKGVVLCFALRLCIMETKSENLSQRYLSVYRLAPNCIKELQQNTGFLDKHYKYIYKESKNINTQTLVRPI